MKLPPPPVVPLDNPVAPPVSPTRRVDTSGGLVGGGDLSADRTLSIADNGVTMAKLADLSAAGLLGAVAAGDPSYLTPTAVTALLNLATTSAKGLSPVLPNDATKFLDGTGAYSTPSISAGLLGDGSDGALHFDGVSAVAGFSLVGTTYTQTRTVFATSVTIDSGVTVVLPAGEVYCTGNTANNGTVTADGQAGATSTGTSGAGGTGATGICFAANGANGGNGGNSGGAPGATGGAVRMPFGTVAGTVAGGTGNGGAGGIGQGGAGGGSNGNAGGSGGTTSVSAANLQIYLAKYVHAVTLRQPDAQNMAWGSAGGGGRGGSGTGAGGGGGGASATGWVWHSKSYSGSGTWTARGGAGGDGANATTVGTGGGGGGGGAGGIAVFIVVVGSAPVAAVTGGAGGTGGLGNGGGAAGGNGGAGGAGQTVTLRLGVSA